MMSMEKPQNWFDQRVEAYIDGELDASERSLFVSRLKLDESLRREVEQARLIQGTLRDMPSLQCPSDVRKRVLEMTGSRPRGFAWGWAGAACAVLVAAIAFGLMRPPAGPSELELAQARADMETAMAYLSRAGQMAGRQAGQQWIESGIARPVSAGLRRPTEVEGDAI